MNHTDIFPFLSFFFFKKKQNKTKQNKKKSIMDTIETKNISIDQNKNVLHSKSNTRTNSGDKKSTKNKSLRTHTSNVVISPHKNVNTINKNAIDTNNVESLQVKPIIPTTPFFDNIDKWAAHVSMSTSTIISQKSIGTDGFTFPVRIEKWGHIKTSSSNLVDKSSNSSIFKPCNIGTTSNRGNIILPGTQSDQKSKNGKREMKSYHVSAECASLTNVVLENRTRNDVPYIFIPLDVKVGRNSNDLKIDAPISRITGEIITHRVINVGQRLRFFTNNSNIESFTSMDVGYAVKTIASITTAPSIDPTIWEIVNSTNKLGTPTNSKNPIGTSIREYKPTRFSKLPQLPLEVLQAYYDRTSDKLTDIERINLELEFPEIAFQRQTLRDGQNVPLRICSNLSSSMFMSAVKMDYIGQGVGDLLSGLGNHKHTTEIENAFDWIKSPLSRNIYIVSRPAKIQSEISQNRGRVRLDTDKQPNQDITTRWAVEVFNGTGLKCYSKIGNREVVCLRFSAVGETWQPGCYYKDPECISTRILINAYCAAWDKQIIQAFGITNVDAWSILAPQIIEFGTNIFSCRVNVSHTNRIPIVAQNSKNMIMGDQLTCSLDVEEIFSDVPTLLNTIGIPVSRKKVIEILGCSVPTEADIYKCDTSFLPATVCLSEHADMLAMTISGKCTYRIVCNVALDELVPSINGDTDIGDAIFSSAWCGNDDITLTTSGKVSKATDDLRKSTKYMKINDCHIRYIWAIRPDIKASHNRFDMVQKIFYEGGQYDENGIPIIADPGAIGKRSTIDSSCYIDINKDSDIDDDGDDDDDMTI